MDSPRFVGIVTPAGRVWYGVSALDRREAEMNATAAPPVVLLLNGMYAALAGTDL